MLSLGHSQHILELLTALVLLKMPALYAGVEILRIATFNCFCMFKICKTLIAKKISH